MYQVSNFEGRQMFAVSVPPSAHQDLEKDFKELSRINFYLGHSSIDHMITAVEKASLEDIEKGELQLVFAVKEIQEFLASDMGKLSLFSDNKLSPSLYFDKTFKNILLHTVEVLEHVYKNPTAEEAAQMVSSMLKLTHESNYLYNELKEVGVVAEEITPHLKTIQEKYEKIYNLRNHYENLSSLDNFMAYEEAAKVSVVEQLAQPYSFNYSELSKIYLDRDDWMATMSFYLEKRKKTEQPDYVYDTKAAQELKDAFLIQINSFNRLLKNGVVNYVLSYAAHLSRESFYTSEKSKIPAESFFDREIGYHKKSLERMTTMGNYHREEIAKLEKNKESYIQQKVDDKEFYDVYLTTLYRQEKNIISSLDKLKNKLLNVKERDSLTFTGDIENGFVIGSFSQGDKVMLVHKDTTVNVPNAVYAMILTKEKYLELVESKKLAFNEEFKENDFSACSNFWSYGQFLQELNSSEIQKFFLGQEFDLIDQTVLQEKRKNKM